jgi:hypothetical protein
MGLWRRASRLPRRVRVPPPGTDLVAAPGRIRRAGRLPPRVAVPRVFGRPGKQLRCDCGDPAMMGPKSHLHWPVLSLTLRLDFVVILN